MYAPSFGRRCKAAADSVFGDCPWDHELEQVVAAARLAADARHLEAAEGLATYQCAGDRPVEIEIPDQEFALGTFERRRAAAIDAAGQSVFRAVGDAKGLAQVARPNDGEH